MSVPFTQFEDLLWEWIAIQERSIRLGKRKDALWWCNERPSVGGFAGAVWRCGGYVLQEYNAPKKCRSHALKKSNNKIAGRVDMDFELGGRKYTAEAKQCWPDLGTPSAISKIEASMQEAEKNLADHEEKYLDYTRLAIVFASPRCTKDQCAEELIPKWVESAAQNVKSHAHAWVFPHSARNLWWEKTRCKYPGAAMFIQQAKN